MSWLNYHHLMYFRMIATEGSISKASEKLLVGQPALSAQLKQLEESLNQQLFERKNRRLILTDAGKAALKYANQIHSLGGELVEVLNNKSLTIRPTLVIGALDSVPKNLIVSLTQSAQSFMDCHIVAVDGTGDELYRQLISHSVDIVVSNYHIMSTDDKSIFDKSIGRFKIGVYGTEKFLKLKKGFPRSLANQPLVVPTLHSKLRQDVEQFMEGNNIPMKIVTETQDTAVQKLLAFESEGLIFEPEFAVKSYLKEKKMSRIGYLPGVYEEFFLSSTKRMIENPVATYIMNEFKFMRPKLELFD